MFSYFEEKKKLITAFLASIFERDNELLGAVNRFSAEVRSRLFSYAVRGKMIRGGLVFLGNELFGGAENHNLTAIAAALEIFQSALLIHDDIMDRDDVRRGEKTLHRRYAEEAAALNLADPDHVGEALGICVGDIAFFIAFGFITESGLPDELVRRLAGLFSRELALVGVAQMEDVAWGARNMREHTASEEEILNLYRHKTGRYTFSLPLAAGALAAGRKPDEITRLENLGEKLGIIFQIKDDEIGLFGDEAAVGKPVGSDIREGKKTVYFNRLAGLLEGKDRDRFFTVFGNRRISRSDIEFVRSLVVRHGIKKDNENLAKSLSQECEKEISGLRDTQPEKKQLLLSLLAYNLTRGA